MDPIDRLWRRYFEHGAAGAAYLLLRLREQTDPGAIDVARALGLLLAQDGQIDEAVSRLEAVVKASPGDAVSWYNLSAALARGKRYAEAIRALRRCLRVSPEYGPALELLPFALLEHGAARQALARIRALPPGNRSAFSLRTEGRALAAASRPDAAVTAFDRALALAPDDWRTMLAAGDSFGALREYSLSHRYLMQLESIDGDIEAAKSRRTAVLFRVGDLEGLRKETADLPQTDGLLRDSLLRGAIMDPDQSGISLRKLHDRKTASTRIPRFTNSRDTDRPLRAAVVSGEFSAHTAGFFLRPLLAGLRQDGLDVVVYDCSGVRAARNLPPGSVQLDPSLTDAEIAARIREDRIDALLDVSGRLPGNRTGVFDLQPAPVQISYPRYPATAGCRRIGWRITDRWADPEGAVRGHYLEHLLRVDGGYLAYDPPRAPRVTELPAHRNRHLTFGFFLDAVRLNSVTIEQIAAVISAVPGSRLLIHADCPDYDRPGRWARQRIEDAFAALGIRRARITFRGPADHLEHLELLGSVDIALDGTPYNGQTSTCECLWMGVPVLTVAGERFASRVSTSILHTAGFAEWSVASTAEMVEAGVSWSVRHDELARFRTEARKRLKASPLLDEKRLGSEIHAAIRTAWRSWCETGHSQADVPARHSRNAS